MKNTSPWKWRKYTALKYQQPVTKAWLLRKHFHAAVVICESLFRILENGFLSFRSVIMVAFKSHVSGSSCAMMFLWVVKMFQVTKCVTFHFPLCGHFLKNLIFFSEYFSVVFSYGNWQFLKPAVTVTNSCCSWQFLYLTTTIADFSYSQ